MAGRGGLGVGAAQLGCLGVVGRWRLCLAFFFCLKFFAQYVIPPPHAPASLGEEAGPTCGRYRVGVRVSGPVQSFLNFRLRIPRLPRLVSAPGPTNRIVVFINFLYC